MSNEEWTIGSPEKPATVPVGDPDTADPEPIVVPKFPPVHLEE